MLNSTERECTLKFLGYHSREFSAKCLEGRCTSNRIITKITLHKTEANKFRPQPLTQKEQLALSGFLCAHYVEFSSWLKTYELGEKPYFDAVKRMGAC